MSAPQIFHATRLIQGSRDWPQCSSDGRRWRPARPVSVGGISVRFKAAWLVFTGKADAVVWGDEA